MSSEDMEENWAAEVKNVMDIIHEYGVVAARKDNPYTVLAALLLIASFEAMDNGITKEEYIGAAEMYFDGMQGARNRG